MYVPKGQAQFTSPNQVKEQAPYQKQQPRNFENKKGKKPYQSQYEQYQEVYKPKSQSQQPEDLG